MFAYDSRSLIEQLRNKNGANVYWAEMYTPTSFHLMELKGAPIMGQFDRYYGTGDNPPPNETRLPTISRITMDDLYKHIIFCMNNYT